MYMSMYKSTCDFKCLHSITGFRSHRSGVTSVVSCPECILRIKLGCTTTKINDIKHEAISQATTLKF